MFKKMKDFLVDFIKSEYKFLLLMITIYIVCTWPVNYYIIIGGGINDIDKRVEVKDEYKSKGSFNMSYVSELRGSLLAYGLSYLIPSWEREPMSSYQYSVTEDIDDIEFRGDIDLKNANSSAIKTAYTLANKDIKLTSSRTYVIATFDDFKTNLKVQDEIISINGEKRNDAREYSKYLQQFKGGDSVTIKIIRDSKEKDVECKLGDIEGRIILGILLSDVKEYDTNPYIDIKFKKRESGPSAGLMTTLEIYNSLVKKDITKGYDIAGTGTVNEFGYVGPIGGVKYKLIGASHGGADVFLVPDGENYKEAMKVKKDKKLKIKVIPVTTVKEAIEKLNKLK